MRGDDEKVVKSVAGKGVASYMDAGIKVEKEGKVL